MNIWKIAFWICLVLLIMTGMRLVYEMTKSRNQTRFREVMVEAYAQATDGLVDVVIKGAGKYSKAEILAILQEVAPERKIRSDDSTIHYGPVLFRFKQDSLVAVQHRRF